MSDGEEFDDDFRTMSVTPTFAEIQTDRGRPIVVPGRLWRLPIGQALATVSLPIGVNWSRPDATYELRDRRQRARCYEVVLREGRAEDLRQFVDGALLIDVWDDLVLPIDVRAAWQPLIDETLGVPGSGHDPT